jgi:hypothetical protein
VVVGWWWSAGGGPLVVVGWWRLAGALGWWRSADGRLQDFRGVRSSARRLREGSRGLARFAWCSAVRRVLGARGWHEVVAFGRNYLEIAKLEVASRRVRDRTA